MKFIAVSPGDQSVGIPQEQAVIEIPDCGADEAGEIERIMFVLDAAFKEIFGNIDVYIELVS